MSYDRAEFASSKFVNAIGDKKDVQFAGKDLRSFRTSPYNLHGASYDEYQCSVERTEPWDFLISHPFCHVCQYIGSLRADMRAVKFW